MTGLKSGSGDDLWGDDGDESDGSGESADAGDDRTPDSTPPPTDRDEAGTNETGADDEATDDAASALASSASSGSERSTDAQSYVVRRAVRDKSVQFERDERLTFFVHDDVAEGERDLVTDLQSALGRDVPKFDVREAVYRAALRNPEDVLDELLAMGYSTEDD